jgi:hypothetical protein
VAVVCGVFAFIFVTMNVVWDKLSLELYGHNPRYCAMKAVNGLVDAPGISRSKTDSAQFSAPSGTSIKVMFEQASSVEIDVLSQSSKCRGEILLPT